MEASRPDRRPLALPRRVPPALVGRCSLATGVGLGARRRAHQRHAQGVRVVDLGAGAGRSGRTPTRSGGRTKGTINLDTEAQLVRLRRGRGSAAALLRAADRPDELARDVSVEVPANTTVLVITYERGRPARRAQAGSHAFAEAYLRNREETAQADLDAQIAA